MTWAGWLMDGKKGIAALESSGIIYVDAGRVNGLPSTRRVYILGDIAETASLRELHRPKSDYRKVLEG